MCSSCTVTLARGEPERQFARFCSIWATLTMWMIAWDSMAISGLPVVRVSVSLASLDTYTTLRPFSAKRSKAPPLSDSRVYNLFKCRTSQVEAACPFSNFLVVGVWTSGNNSPTLRKNGTVKKIMGSYFYSQSSNSCQWLCMEMSRLSSNMRVFRIRKCSA